MCPFTAGICKSKKKQSAVKRVWECWPRLEWCMAGIEGKLNWCSSSRSAYDTDQPSHTSPVPPLPQHKPSSPPTPPPLTHTFSYKAWLFSSYKPSYYYHPFYTCQAILSITIIKAKLLLIPLIQANILTIPLSPAKVPVLPIPLIQVKLLPIPLKKY